ncbi:hypothetical protein QPK87_25315 [Kamptonema cortianum]|nr:hypothetical protein [Kamptonema cortianum]
MLKYPYTIEDDFCVVPNLADFNPTYSNPALPEQLAKFFTAQSELHPWQKLESLLHLPPVEPSSSDCSDADSESNSVQGESNESNTLHDEDSSDYSNNVEQFPNWANELPESALKALYEAVRSNLEQGKSRSWIIKNILQGKSEKYTQSAFLFDWLTHKFGDN